MRSNGAADPAMAWAMGWDMVNTVDGVVGETVDHATGRVVDAVVHRAVSGAMYWAVDAAMGDDPPHPSLGAFLASVGVGAP